MSLLNVLAGPVRAEFPGPPSDGSIAGNSVEGSAPVSLTSWQIGHLQTNLENRGNSLSGRAGAAKDNPASQSALLKEKTGPDRPVTPLDLASFPSLAYSFPGNPVSPTDIANLASQKVPPDSMGAVGPTQFVMAINGLVRVFNKTTGIPETPFGPNDPDLETFFAPVMTAGSGVTNSAATPRVRYDRFSSRWFILAADMPQKAGVSQPNRLMLAVSDNSTIASGTPWKFYYFTPDTILTGFSNTYATNPTLGVDANALYIGVNLFNTNPQVFVNSAALVVRKSSVTGNGQPFVTGFAPLIDTNGPFIPQGVDNLDSSVSEGYFIGVGIAAMGLSFTNQLQLRKVLNPGEVPTITPNIALTVPGISSPLPVPHKGSGGSPGSSFNMQDNRLTNAVIQKGSLWTVHTIGVNASGSATNSNSRDGLRWYEISLPTTPVASPKLRQSGTVFDTSYNQSFYWVPSLTVSGQGHTVIGFNAAGDKDYISAAFAGRASSDSLNTTRPPVFFKNDSVAYTPANNPVNLPFGRAWGRYSFTSLDPEDNMTFWTIQEYPSNTDADNDHVMDGYGIVVARINAPPPATITEANPPFVIADQNNVDITISGSQVDGSGFYDPGPAFSKHLTASVGGGVTVNSVTYLNPTTVRLNVSAGGVTPGQYDVSLTNPDGQTVTASNLLKVTCYQAIADDAADYTAGSLRVAVDNIAGGGCATLNLKNVTRPIVLTGPLELPTGIILSTAKPCSAGQVEIISNGYAGAGLTINGGYFFGIYIHGFEYPLLKAYGGTGANHFSCVKIGTT
jgi:hypothetical protein